MNNETEQERVSVWQFLRSTFGRGLVVIVPVVITIWVLQGLFNAVDGIISPIFDRILYRHIPGLGFVTMIVLILIIGLQTRNLFGMALLKFFERLISSIPLARTIYSAMKDLLSAFQSGKKGKSFRQVVLIEYPRKELWTIGFVTNELTFLQATPTQELVSVYIPNPPNPTSGMLILAPKESLRVLDITIEDGLKLVLSGGIVTPERLSVK
jgi:uncharacterized membrane protein